MAEYKVVKKFESSIATMKPTVGQRRLTLVLAAVVLIATGIIAPFGAIQLQRIDGFIPATESAILIGEFFTAVLLFSQAKIVGHGRQIAREKRTYSRWCFADLGTACDFIEQFGGALAETGYESHSPAMRREALQSCFYCAG